MQAERQEPFIHCDVGGGYFRPMAEVRKKGAAPGARWHTMIRTPCDLADFEVAQYTGQWTVGGGGGGTQFLYQNTKVYR